MIGGNWRSKKAVIIRIVSRTRCFSPDGALILTASADHTANGRRGYRPLEKATTTRQGKWMNCRVAESHGVTLLYLRPQQRPILVDSDVTHDMPMT